MESENKTTTWPDLAIGLYERLTERGAVITYTFENLTVEVPSGVGEDNGAKWHLDGTIKVTTTDRQSA